MLPAHVPYSTEDEDEEEEAHVSLSTKLINFS